MTTFLIRSLLKLTLAALYFALPLVVGQRLDLTECAGMETAVAVLEAPAAVDSAPAPTEVTTRARSSMRWRLTLPVAVLGR